MKDLIEQYHRVADRRYWGFTRPEAREVNALEMRNICRDIRKQIIQRAQ